MVECARLEIVLRRNTYGGSNPSLCARRPSNVKASEGRFKFAVFFICCVLQVLYIFLQIPFWH